MSDGDEATAELIGPGLARRGAARARRSLPEVGARDRGLLFAAVTWLPLAILAAIDGELTTTGGSLSHDVAMYARLLWVGPLLVAAGRPVDHELAEAVGSWRS